jgi:hypothetical protein
MSDEQLMTLAKAIVAAMTAGEMNKVTQIYERLSAAGTMEDAAKIEKFIEGLMK